MTGRYHVYSLIGPAADGSGLTWLSFGVGKSPKDAHVVHWGGDKSLSRVGFYDQRGAKQVAESFHPGTTLMLTDASAPRTTRATPKGYSVIASEAAG